MNEEVRPGQMAGHPPEKKRNSKALRVSNKRNSSFSPNLVRPGDCLCDLERESAEVKGDWKPSPEGRTRASRPDVQMSSQNSPARRTGRRSMGQATRNAETQERTVRWALEFSSQNEVASLSSVLQG